MTNSVEAKYSYIIDKSSILRQAAKPMPQSQVHRLMTPVGVLTVPPIVELNRFLNLIKYSSSVKSVFLAFPANNGELETPMQITVNSTANLVFIILGSCIIDL